MLRRTIGSALFLALTLSTTTSAQGFDVFWYTIDGGAGYSVGADFEVEGTIGQPDAGTVMAGGGFTLSGGFWPGAAEQPCSLPGDITGDGAVDLNDLAIILSNYGVPSGAVYGDGDADGDGDVDLADLAILLSAYGTSCP